MDMCADNERVKPSDKRKNSEPAKNRKMISSLFEVSSEESVAYKVFNFFFYGAAQTFNSYVSIYLKTLGLTAGHVGLINGTHPLLQVIGAPLAGILGDKYKIKRLLLLFGIVIMTIRTMLYLPFQPHNQTCKIVYINKTNDTVVSTKRIPYRIWKRSSDPYSHSGMTGSWADVKAKTMADTKSIAREPREVESAHGNVKNEEVNLQENALSNEIDPFLSPPNVIVEKNRDHKVIYIKNEDQGEIHHIFVILLCLTLFGEVFEALVSTIADTCCLDYLGDKRESFGLFRFWGALGAALTSPLCGVVFDHFAVEICGRRISGYHFVFYFYFGYMCVAFLSSTHFHYRYDTTAPMPINKNIRDALWNLRYGIFLLASLYMGLCYGFLTSFSFWFLDDLGASATLLGVASSLRSVSENCVYLFSPIVLTLFGHVKVASGCLMAFSVVFISYSFVKNPWIAIPLEILYTAAYAFSWTTCVSYLNKAASPGSSTIIQGIVQASFWGLGFGSGSIIGGFSFRVFGDRETFRGFAIASFVVFLFFVSIQLILASTDKRAAQPEYKSLSQGDISEATE